MVVLRFGSSFRHPPLPRFLARAAAAGAHVAPRDDRRPAAHDAGDDTQPRPRPLAARGAIRSAACNNSPARLCRDFTGVLLFLVIGAAAAAIFSTGFDRNLLAPVGQNAVPRAARRYSPRTAPLPLQHHRRLHHRRLRALLRPGQDRLPRRRPAHRPEALLALPQRLQGPASCTPCGCAHLWLPLS